MDYTTDNQAASPASPSVSSKPLSKRLEDQWNEARKASAAWRKEAREDRAFYFGDQWTSEEKAALKEQGRPALVINQIFKSINNLIGRERDSRLDWKALPRGVSDVKAADAITQSLAFVADQTRSKYAISAGFKDCAIGPVGWLEVGMDDTDPSKEPFYVREESWENVWFDPHGRKLDLSDFRYLIRSKLFDLDMALYAYPGQAEVLKKAVEEDKSDKGGTFKDGDDYGNRSGLDITDMDGGGWCDHERQRVRLREHWWWENEKAQFWVYPDGRVTEFAQEAPDLSPLSEGAELRAGTKRCYYYAIAAGKVVLEHGKSPYPFNRFPFVAVWAYVDDKGQPFGVVRMQKDPQKELNVARSRVNESQRSRWALIEKGLMTPGELQAFTDDLARSNFVREVPKLTEGKIQMGSDKADVGAWMGLMETSRREVDDVAGQNEASFGDKSNEKSGKAIQARVAQQGLNLAELFDNLRFARLQVGEMLLAMTQKFYTPAKLQRIVEASLIRENPAADLSWVGTAFANPIEQMRFDIIIDDQAETATERQAAAETYVNMMQMAGPLAASMVPDGIRMSDVPNAEEIAAKLEAQMAPPPPPPGMLPPQGPQDLPGGPLSLPPEGLPPVA